MSASHVALLRGINVGRAKRVAMADLRALVESLGYLEVRTLLNSGNVVFTVPRGARGDPAARIEKAIATELGVTSRVIVITAAELAGIVRAHQLAKANDVRFIVGARLVLQSGVEIPMEVFPKSFLGQADGQRRASGEFIG